MLPKSRYPFPAPSLIPEILELQRKIRDLLAHERDRFLQRVALGAGHAHRVTLDARLNLQLAVLDDADDLLREFRLDTRFNGHAALNFIPAVLLDVARLHAAHVHAALGELAGEDVPDLIELEIGVGEYGQRLVVEFDTRVRALEVEALANFLVGL